MQTEFTDIVAAHIVWERRDLDDISLYSDAELDILAAAIAVEQRERAKEQETEEFYQDSDSKLWDQL